MPISRDTVAGLLQRSVCAPSGDNCQPWRFTVAGDTVSVFNVPDRDRSLYSWGQRSSLVAHGALLENMEIAAGAAGLTAEIETFPEDAGSDCIARVRLSPGPVRVHPLDSSIERRATNRKPFRPVNLMSNQRDALSAAARAPAKVVLCEDAALRARCARAAALNEKVLFENEHMHGFFFSQLDLRPAAARLTAMPVATLELPPPIRAAFPVLGKWPVMRVLSGIGFANGITKANAATYGTGAAMAALVIPDRSPQSYLASGRALQRLWLTATQHGLALQVLAGIGFLMARVAAGEPGLSPAHESIVRTAYADIADATGVHDGVIALLARIGHGPEPSARTPRMPPPIEWLP